MESWKESREKTKEQSRRIPDVVSKVIHEWIPKKIQSEFIEWIGEFHKKKSKLWRNLLKITIELLKRSPETTNGGIPGKSLKEFRKKNAERNSRKIPRKSMKRSREESLKYGIPLWILDGNSKNIFKISSERSSMRNQWRNPGSDLSLQILYQKFVSKTICRSMLHPHER